MQRIDGRMLAERIRAELRTEISEHHLHPKLAVMLVGNDPASQLYVSMKQKAASEAGIETVLAHLPPDTPDDTLISHIRSWNADPTIHGILLQVPLPEGHNTDRLIAEIDPQKDADGFHTLNTEALLAGRGTIIPPLHEGILRLIAQTPIHVNGTGAVIIANSDIFSVPLRYLLEKAGCRVTVCHADDLDRKALLLANIIVIAIGRAQFLKRGMVSPNSCIIDVGTNHDENGKLVGDVDASSLEDVPGYLSPVPGGVGPMTIAMLLKNVADLAKKQTAP